SRAARNRQRQHGARQARMRAARRALEALHGLVDSSQLEQRATEVVLGLGPIGRDLERPLEASRGRRVLAAARFSAPGGVPRPRATRRREIVGFISGHSPNGTTCPPFITNRTWCNAWMSCVGSPSTATRSANNPGAMLPRSAR